MRLDIPFFHNTLVAPEDNRFPAYMPFELYFDESLRLFRQTFDRQLCDLLAQVYQGGSQLVGSMDDNMGAVQVENAYRFLEQSKPSLEHCRILEIGSGNGSLIRRLPGRPARLVGVEPGPSAASSSPPGVEIIRDFFPTPQVSGDFDLILHFNVLEHIPDPLDFMRAQAALLAPGGSIVFGVPSCAVYLKAGDPSILLHQHWSYFTAQSIFTLAERCGLGVVRLEETANGSMLFAQFHAGRDPLAPCGDDLPSLPEVERRFAAFRAVADDLFARYGDFDTVAYCPTRAINLLGSLGRTNVRLVDDDSTLHGRYLPSFARHIESFQSLVDHPAKLVAIFSRTFGDRLKAKCRAAKNLATTRILAIEDLLNTP